MNRRNPFTVDAAVIAALACLSLAENAFANDASNVEANAAATASTEPKSETAPAAEEAASEPAPVNNGRISLNLGATWTSAYFFRGYLQEDEGFIGQPFAEVGFALMKPEKEGELKIDAALGTWNSFHSKRTGATGGGPEVWYESDIYGGLKFGLDRYSLGLIYTIYNYPNNSNLSSVQEVGLKFGVDLPNDEWYGKVLGDPSVGLYFETDNSNVGQDDAAYLQLDLGPSFEIFDGKATLSIPASLGLSVNNYYVGSDDETFGYFSIGATVTVPLCSGEFGAVSLNGGVNALLLGDTTENVNRGDGVDAYGFIGLTVTY